MTDQELRREPWHRHWWIRVPAFIVLLIAVTVDCAPESATRQAAMTGSVDAPAVEAAASIPAEAAVVEPAPQPPPPPPGVGQPAYDGKFEFVVHGLECGIARVGSQYLNETAQGQFCLLRLTARNVGEVEQTFFASNQKLLGPDGVEYSADTAANLWHEDGALSEQVNPGNALQATVVFDIPQGAQVAMARLHDSAFSGGVTVALTA